MSLPNEHLWRAIADAADAETLPRFRAGGEVSNKLSEGFDPVTEADRAAERAVRLVLSRDRPEDAVLGEEAGAEEGSSAYRWVIDPIDGTRSFVAGIPLWMTLVGLERDGRAVAGLASQPHTGERFLATGDGRARLLTATGERKLSVSGRSDPAEAIGMTTDPHLLDEVPEARDAMRDGVRLTRYGADAYAFCLLAAGAVDLVYERSVQPYDVGALIPIVEAAGGAVTTWSGERAEGGGTIVAAASASLHAWALERLAPHA